MLLLPHDKICQQRILQLENSCQDTKLAPHVRHKAGNRAKLHLKSIHILGLTGFVFPELHNFIRHRTVIPGKLLRGHCHLTAGVQQHMADRWASCVQYSLAAAVKAPCLAVDRAVMKTRWQRMPTTPDKALRMQADNLAGLQK